MNNETLLGLFKPETIKIDQYMREDLSTVGNGLLTEVLEYAIFNGGKRVRPLLTVLAAKISAQMKTSEQTEQHADDIYRLALTFEYLHAASLLHDDVIDHADRRRGRTTANKVWSNTHVILAGDFLHTRSMLLAGTIGGKRCLEVIGQATSAMVESEFLQLQNSENIDPSEAGYFQVLRGKTAALISAACQSGIIFSQGSEEQIQALSLYGTNLGLTFQIADDLLDYLGDPKKTGKVVGNDFQEKKMTLPLIYTLSHATEKDKARLHQLLAASEDERKNALDEARQIIEQSDGFTYAKQKGAELIKEAVAAISIFPECPEKEILTALAYYVLAREK